MLFCARRQFALASVSFALACLFRSNGTLLAGYIIWGMLVEPLLNSALSIRAVFSLPTISRIISCFLLTLVSLSPFLWHQYIGYLTFCAVPASERRPWCTNTLPLIYSFVQSHYWDVGLFRYWSLQQAPNILLAAPALALLFHGSISHIRSTLLPRAFAILGKIYKPVTATSRGTTEGVESPEHTRIPLDPSFNPSLSPHAIHALVLSTILLTSAHTQIALRLVSALPFMYWSAARLFFRMPIVQSERNIVESVGSYERKSPDVAGLKPPQLSRWWVGWSLAWGAISLVTWGVFLPPA